MKREETQKEEKEEGWREEVRGGREREGKERMFLIRNLPLP